MIPSKPLDILYKSSVFIGIFIIVISLYIAKQYYDTQEQDTVHVFEAAILANLDMQSLAEQLLAIQSALNQAEYSIQNETEETEGVSSFSDTEIQKLQADAALLQQELAESAAKARTLEQTKLNIRNKTTGLIIMLTLALTAGSIITLLGGLGWIYHVKIYPERRNREREIAS